MTSRDFREFSSASLPELRNEVRELELDLPLPDDISSLSSPLVLESGRTRWTIQNRLACHPMEGSDANADGTPGPLTIRRYERFAAGGAGLIWFEAVAVVPEGKASARQLAISEDNVQAFASIVKRISDVATEKFGAARKPLVLMQLTHSGRFSKPEGKPAPVIACRNPYLDERCKVDDTTKPITDAEIELLEERFAAAALLAQRAGFDGVDIKACHRYLASELLSAYTRPGRYGETYEGRTRFILNLTDRIRNACGPDFLLGARVNLYDGIQYPYGWGTDKDDVGKMDLAEPLRLAQQLHDKGVRLLNATMGTPYYNPHVNRPYDKGGYQPKEHPLVGVSRLLEGAAAISRAVPGLAVVGTGYSWMRQYAANLAAGAVSTGGASLVGFGREAFAYPDFARDILEKGGMVKEKCCITCGKCAEILRAGGTAGCVIKDSAMYAPIYRACCGPVA
jgi:2,4-dienoyl-CoA reductase-like NADH-dependent reductase (Old Yellow Enzyme family)